MNLKKLIPIATIQADYSFDYKFSVFTPVYNRSNTLKRVFKSLNDQTFRDFELIIINDGSTDNSNEVIQDLMQTATFKVNYINNKENKHKMACFIQAIKFAKGEFILPFDSDDECTPNALKVFNDSYENIPEEMKGEISGVTCLCEDQFGNLVGEKFPNQPYFSNTIKRQFSNPKSSEKWGFTKTQILKSIEIDESIFSKGLIPEGLIWNFIAKEGYKTKYVNDILRIYYIGSDNSLSVQNLKKNSLGMAIYSLSILNWFYKDYLMTYPKAFIKRVYTLLRAAHFLKFNLNDYLNAIDSVLLKLIFITGWPFKRFF